MVNIVNQIIFAFSTNKSLYIGEGLTMSEHMIQTAMLAEKDQCSDNLVCSSLLHDYGHFIIDDPAKLVDEDINGKHEIIGANYLKKFFSYDIIQPILLHVEAKKYLARDKKYYTTLSNASKISLKLQGGPMTNNEVKKFELNKCYKDAIKLRMFDERAKKKNLTIKKIEDYRELLLSMII